MSTEPRGPQAVVRARALWPELAGWGVALALSVAVVAVVASTSGWLLYTDGDSVLLPLIVHSFALGQPQDWAMSPVLFLPETVLYGMLSLLGLGTNATLTLNAVVNLLALYGALRLVAGRCTPGRAPILGAGVAFAGFCALALLEGPADKGIVQLALLQTTTTYYALTVVAGVAVVGIARRVLDRAVRRSDPPVLAGAALAVIAAVSVLSNPLFAIWVVLPLAAVLLAVAAARRIPRGTALVVVAALAGGSVLGWLARNLFADHIVAQSGNYLRGWRWVSSAEHYGALVAATAGRPSGALWLATVIALVVVAGFGVVRAWRRADAAVVVVCAVAVVGPVTLAAGAIVFGTDAVRYLQPWVFLPIAALAALPWRRPAFAPALRRTLAATLALVLVALTVVAAPATIAAASRTDADLACVVDWVEQSGRTGGGQFWTVRSPKAHLSDPSRLVQLDHTLRVYTWLTNRADSDGAEVTFLVTSPDTVPFALPPGFSAASADAVDCGRYTIVDFGDRALPLGPPRD